VSATPLPFADFINAKRISANMIARMRAITSTRSPCYAEPGGAMFANGDTTRAALSTASSGTRGRLRLRQIWFSARPAGPRKFIRESKCFCTYECFLTINILFNPRMMPSVLKEWSSLKMRKAWRKLTGQQPARATLATCGTGSSKTATTTANA
jgi:hypothetical protein